MKAWEGEEFKILKGRVMEICKVAKEELKMVIEEDLEKATWEEMVRFETVLQLEEAKVLWRIAREE